MTPDVGMKLAKRVYLVGNWHVGHSVIESRFAAQRRIEQANRVKPEVSPDALTQGRPGAKVWICAVVALLEFSIGAGEAWAQPKREVFAQAGYGRVAEDEGSLGDGVAFGAGMGLLLNDRWEWVIDLRRQDNTRRSGPGRFFHDGRTLAVGSAFLYHFSKRRLQPFLRLGASYARMNASRGFTASDLSPGDSFEGTQNFFGPDVGLGTKIFVRGNLSLQPEFRFLMGGSGPYTAGVDVVEPGLFVTTFSIGFGYHW